MLGRVTRVITAGVSHLSSVRQIHGCSILKSQILGLAPSPALSHPTSTRIVQPILPSYAPQQTQVRQFYAKGSKVHYMDFRYKFGKGHRRTHLLIIRRQKMKKHKRTKWRRKFKCLLAKKRLKREISKEKTFRVELLTMIRRAEQFDPKEYALNKLYEINNKPRPKTKEELLDELKELIRVNRYQVDYIKPKHRRAEDYPNSC